MVILILTDKEKSRRKFLDVHEVRHFCGTCFQILGGTSSFLKLQSLFKGLAREVPCSVSLSFIFIFLITPVEKNAALLKVKIFTEFGESKLKE